MWRRSWSLLPVLCLAVLAPGGAAATRRPAELVFVDVGGAVSIAGADGVGMRRLTRFGDMTDVAPSPRGVLAAFTTLTLRADSISDGFGVVDLATGVVRWRLDNVGVYSLPEWAPDGKRFAFLLGDDELWFGGAARSSVFRVARGVGAFAWRGDGRALVYATPEGLVAYELRTHRRTILAPAPAAIPSWSPDGAEVAYISRGNLLLAPTDRGGRPRLLARNTTGRRRTPVNRIAWSPDGKQLAYLQGGALRVTRIAAGGRPRLLTRSVIDLAWAPDSRSIAVSRRGAGDAATALFVVGRDGGGLRRLTSPLAPENDRLPRWSPDGSQIAYQRTARGVARVYVVAAGGGEARPVAGDDIASETDGSSFAWLHASLSLPPQEPLVTVHPAVQVSSGSSVGGLAADGNQVAALLWWDLGEGYLAWESLLWSPTSGRKSGSAIRCDPAGDATEANPTTDDVAGPVLAGDRYGYVCSGELEQTRLYTASFDQPHPTTPVLDDPDGAPVSLAGAGDLLVVSVHGDLDRIDAGGAMTPLRRYGHDVFVLGVDTGRALLRTEPTTVEVVAADGSLTATLAVPQRARLLLRGPRLWAASGSTLTATDLDGRQQLQLTLESGFDLADAAGDLVLYTVGRRLHLRRVSDGRDLALRLPGQISYPAARFTADGGFVAGYNAATTQPGVLAYVAPAEVQSLLAATA